MNILIYVLEFFTVMSIFLIGFMYLILFG